MSAKSDMLSGLQEQLIEPICVVLALLYCTMHSFYMYINMYAIISQKASFCSCSSVLWLCKKGLSCCLLCREIAVCSSIVELIISHDCGKVQSDSELPTRTHGTLDCWFLTADDLLETHMNTDCTFAPIVTLYFSG